MYYDNSRVVHSHSNRKRPRSNDEENKSFAPSSKKFNDTDTGPIFPDASSLPQNNVSQMHNQNNLMDTSVPMADIHQSTVGINVVGAGHQYSPELSLAENPYYYRVNGILYEAHMQRLFRSSIGSA